MYTENPEPRPEIDHMVALEKSGDKTAMEFVLRRRIPMDRIKELFYTPNTNKLMRSHPKYRDGSYGDSPRIIIPYYNTANELVGVQGRALTHNEARYVSMKIIEDEPMIYNRNRIKYNERLYVTEGSFDSMFFPNAIAACGIALNSLDIKHEDVVYILDNEPKNTNVINEARKLQKSGKRMFIWPPSIRHKDINDTIVKEGFSQREMIDIIENNIYDGLSLLMKISTWQNRN